MVADDHDRPRLSTPTDTPDCPPLQANRPLSGVDCGKLSKCGVTRNVPIPPPTHVARTVKPRPPPVTRRFPLPMPEWAANTIFRPLGTAGAGAAPALVDVGGVSDVPREPLDVQPMAMQHIAVAHRLARKRTRDTSSIARAVLP